MNIPCCARAGVLVVAAATLVSAAQAQTSAPSPGAIQNKPARVDAALVPHGKCPTNYRLDFVSSSWIRCTFNSPNAQAPKQTYVAPVCDSGYTLQDAAASKAPEKNLYRCAKT